MRTRLTLLSMPLALGALSAVAPDAPPPPAPAATAPAAEAFAALDYFQASCARCHGPYGDAYGNQYAAETRDALRDAIWQMCEGPAAAPVEEPALDRLLAMHEARREGGAPYVHVLSVDGNTVKGEAVPGTRVTANGVEAKADGHAWTIEAAAGAELVAERDGKRTRVEARAGAYGPRP